MNSIPGFFLRTAIERAENHIIFTDPDGKILFANAGVTRITGYENEEIIGQTPRLWGRQMPRQFYTEFWRIIKTEKKPFYGELTNRRKNGQTYTAKAIVTPIVENGILAGFIGTEDDITDVKENEKKFIAQMREMERMNKLMVDRELKMIELKKEIEKLSAKR